jgi:uncharacterized Zn-finger protein
MVETRHGTQTPNDRRAYEIDRSQLPLHCPLPEMSLWNSHPRVFLPIEKTGYAKCPYCGTDYRLRD